MLGSEDKAPGSDPAEAGGAAIHVEPARLVHDAESKQLREQIDVGGAAEPDGRFVANRGETEAAGSVPAAQVVDGKGKALCTGP